MIIRKYSLTSRGETKIVVPVGSRVICIAPEHGYPYVWIEEMDGELKMTAIQILGVMSGEEFRGYSDYVGTVHNPAVIHYYRKQT